MTEIIHHNKYADELKKFFLSDSKVSRQIEDISKDQFEQLIARIKRNSKYVIQIDETTDTLGKARLLGYVRYCYEDFLFCKALERCTTNKAVFLKISKVLEEVGLKWQDCVRVCTDRAAAM